MKRDIIRNLQPDDLLVITIRADQCTPELADRVARTARSELVCQVMVVPDIITVGTKRHWWQR